VVVGGNVVVVVVDVVVVGGSVIVVVVDVVVVGGSVVVVVVVVGGSVSASACAAGLCPHAAERRANASMMIASLRIALTSLLAC